MLGFYFFGNLHLLFKYHKSGVSENTVAEQNVSVQCHFNFLLSLICVPFQRLMETPLWLFVKVIIMIQTSRSVYKSHPLTLLVLTMTSTPTLNIFMVLPLCTHSGDHSGSVNSLFIFIGCYKYKIQVLVMRYTVLGFLVMFLKWSKLFVVVVFPWISEDLLAWYISAWYAVCS